MHKKKKKSVFLLFADFKVTLKLGLANMYVQGRQLQANVQF